MKPQLFLLTFLLSNMLYSQETPPNMALIPAGEFTMGKNTPNPTDWQPEHVIRDLNVVFLNNQLDLELKKIVIEFGILYRLHIHNSPIATSSYWAIFM